MGGMSSPLDRLRHNVATRSIKTEMERVIALPVVNYDGNIDLEQIQKEDRKIELRLIQRQALQAIAECRGGFLPIGVGEGKTYIGLLAGSVLDADLCVYVGPAQVIKQIKRERNTLSRDFRLIKITAMSYGCLSRPNGTAILTELFKESKRPLLVLDEAHKIRHGTAARTKRVIRFLQSRPETMVVAMSGTLTSKSLNDFSHLAEMCLRERSFMPRDTSEIRRWAECLDAKARPIYAALRWLDPLREWAALQDREQFQTLSYVPRYMKEQARKAFALRMRSAAGVVASADTSVKASLRILRLLDLPIPDEVATKIRNVYHTGTGPNGDAIVDDLERWRVLRQLAAGFWYRWVWKDGVVDHTWLDARNDWNRHVRHELETQAREGYDSPALVRGKIESELLNGRVQRPLHRALQTWMAQEHKSEPPVEAVWISDYLIKATVHWSMRQKRPVLVWYESQAVQERLKDYGLQMYDDRVTLDLGPVAASIRSHGTGLNMQGWDCQIVIEPPSGGATWEQLLGRTHRLGQESDTVTCAVWQHADILRSSFNNAGDDARFIAAVTGVPQRLEYADIFVSPCE